MSRTTLGLLFVAAVALATFELICMVDPMKVGGILDEINAMLLENKDSKEKVSMLAELNSDPDLIEDERRILAIYLDLNKLAKLGETNPSTCNQRGHEILRKNYELLAALEGPTEMDRVLNDHAIEHANVCLHKYFEKSLIVYKTVQTKYYQSLNYFVGEIIRSRRTDGRIPSEEREGSGYFWHLKIREISGEQDARLAHKMLVHFAIENRHPYLRYLFGFIDEQKVVHRGAVRKIYNEFLIKPCEDYIEMFGPDTFAPANFDYMTLEGPQNFLNKHHRSFMGNGDNKFLYGLRDYRICHALLRNRKGHSEDRFFDDIMLVISKTII